jgi:hypothetical protein
MATFTKLVDDEVIVPIDVALDGESMPWRQLYGYPAGHLANHLIPWLRDTLPAMRSQVGAEESPEEQVYGLLDLYVTGEPLILGDMYKPLNPHPNGVWELRTIDVRIFGWFHRQDCFIGVFANDSTPVHRHRLHTGYANEIVRLRNSLDLDEPKFIPGADPNAVLSIRP